LVSLSACPRDDFAEEVTRSFLFLAARLPGGMRPRGLRGAPLGPARPGSPRVARLIRCCGLRPLSALRAAALLQRLHEMERPCPGLSQASRRFLASALRSTARPPARGSRPLLADVEPAARDSISCSPSFSSRSRACMCVGRPRLVTARRLRRLEHGGDRHALPRGRTAASTACPQDERPTPTLLVRSSLRGGGCRGFAARDPGTSSTCSRSRWAIWAALRSPDLDRLSPWD